MTLEKWIEETAKGKYRADSWEVTGIQFGKGTPVRFDPFPFAENLGPVYCTFIRYVDEDEKIAEIRVPPESSEQHDWFREPMGNYYVHNRYLTPQ